eukprot:6161806-Pyramimonas_sp.AAC.1
MVLFPRALAQMGGEWKPSPMHIILSSTGPVHYLAPIGNFSTEEEVDQQYLHERVMNHVNWFISFKPLTAASRTPAADYHREQTPLDTGTSYIRH